MKPLLYCTALACAALAGCATPGQHAQYRPTAADDPSNGCLASIAYDKRFVPLRAKIAINLRTDNLPLQMLSDKSYANDDDKAVLSEWIAARAECARMGESFRAAYAPPEYRANITAAQAFTTSAAARLYSGEITYGEFNRLRSEAATAATMRSATAQQRQHEATAAAQAQDDANQRAAVGAALQNMQNTMLIQEQVRAQQIQQNRPINTDCQRFGNTVSCTSR